MENHTGYGGSIPWERLTERLNGEWALPALEDRLEHIVHSDMLQKEHKLTVGVLTALGNIGNSTAGVNVAKVLLNGNVDERVVAAKTLKTCFVPDAEDALFLAVDDSVGAVRAQVVRTLGVLAEQGYVDRQKVIGVCEKTIHDSGWWVRKYAAESLAGLGEEGITVLQQIVTGDDKYASERAEEQLLLSGGGKP